MRLTPASDGFVKALPWHPGHAIACSCFFQREPTVRAPLRGIQCLDALDESGSALLYIDALSCLSCGHCRPCLHMANPALQLYTMCTTLCYLEKLIQLHLATLLTGDPHAPVVIRLPSRSSVAFPALTIKASPACAEFPWSCCPRAALGKVLELAESKFGFKFRVGYESEFMLLREREPGSQPPFRPVDNSVYSQSSAFNAMAPGMRLYGAPTLAS